MRQTWIFIVNSFDKAKVTRDSNRPFCIKKPPRQILNAHPYPCHVEINWRWDLVLCAWTKSDNLPIDESGVKSDNSISIQKISTHKHKVRLHMINTNLFASFPVIIDYIGDKTRVWRGMIKKDANYCMWSVNRGSKRIKWRLLYEDAHSLSKNPLRVS